MLEITPLILTFNEAPNLGRTLAKLAWAPRVVVVDSFSTDATLDICKQFPAVEVVQRKFDTFAGQCNFGLEQIKTPWVLSLDADYVLTDELVAELKSLTPSHTTRGYSARFKYCIHGRVLRASLYPPRTVLYRREGAAYSDVGHGHRVQVNGGVEALNGHILHDDRKPLERWLGEQNRYAISECEHLLKTKPEELNPADKIRRKILFAPALVAGYTLFARGLILDGWPGWYYVCQRTLAELFLSLRLIEARLKRD
jgi:glycosyltransferase involved in cell wall biosynthesis